MDYSQSGPPYPSSVGGPESTIHSSEPTIQCPQPVSWPVRGQSFRFLLGPRGREVVNIVAEPHLCLLTVFLTAAITARYPELQRIALTYISPPSIHLDLTPDTTPTMASHEQDDTMPEETQGYKLSQPKQSLAEYQKMGEF
nr:RHO protein GDP dissociation inhibitor [Colletotrichum truncatum]KAF6788357.1 RHO protein GDP dissociation inhibitor [Colletotrichum truncatum]